MGQVIQVNGDYTIKARRAGGANVTFDTGEQVGSVTVTGDLHVLGTTHTFNSQVISDVVLVLNRGETGSGITLRRSGIEIDRGSLDRADFLFDEAVDSWTITHKLTDGTYSYADSNLQLRRILADPSTDNGDLTLISTGTGVVKVAGTTNYETRVLDYTRLPSVVITHIERSVSTHMITVTTATPHGLAINDYVDIHCATFPAFNASNKIILDRTPTTLMYADNGADFAITPVSGYVIKNSLMWVDGSSYVPTDDYLPNMRAVSDYSRSLVNAAIDNFSVNHIEDQDTGIVVYDGVHGGTSYIKFSMDGSEKIRIDSNGQLGIGTSTPDYPLDVIATEVRIQSGSATVKEYIGPQTNSGYLFGSATEIGLKSDTTTSSVILSKDASHEYLTLNAGTGSSEIDFWTAGLQRAAIDSTGKVFINTATGSSQLNISSSNAFGGAGYAGLITLKNTVSGSTLPSKHIKISSAGDFELANDANTTSILKISDAGVTTLVNGLNVIDYIRTTSTSFDLINANAATVNFAGAGSSINIGANSGTLTVNNPTVATTATSLNLFNTVATTVNFAGAGTTINVGSDTTGTTTNLKNATVNIGNGTVSAITTPATTFNLVNDTATTVNFAGAGTTINVGSATTGTTTNLKNATVNVGNGTTSAITTPATTFNLVNDTATTVNFAGAGTAVSIGASTGTTTIHNPTLAVGSGTTSSITTPATTFNLVNDTATTVNFANAATAISIGSALPGTTTIHHDLVVAGNITFNNGATQISSTVLTVDDPLIYLADNNIGDTVDIGFIGAYNFASPPGTHPHTGFIRDASDSGTWKLFSNATEPTGNVVDFSPSGPVVYDNLKIGDLTAAKGTFSGDVKVGNNVTITASSGNITTTGDLSAKKGTFTGDVSGVKGTFTGDVSGAKGTFSGSLSAAGATFTGTVSGITAAMVGAYTTSQVDSSIQALSAAISGGTGTIVISAGTSSTVDMRTATDILAVAHGGTGVDSSTGSGSVVLSVSPTLQSPTIMNNATVGSINNVVITQPTHDATLTLADQSGLTTEGSFVLTLKTTAGTNATFPAGDLTVGYLNIPQNIITGDTTSTVADAGKHALYQGSGTAKYTIDNTLAYDIGTVLTVVNDTGSGDCTITVNGGDLVQAGTGTTGDRKLAADGIATIMKTTTTKWLINGVGLT